MGVFVRLPAELKRAIAVVEKAGLPFKALDENVGTTTGYVSISTMQLAKGLEFRAVAVMLVMMRSFPYRNESKRYRTMRIWKKFTTRSNIFFMSSAPEPGII